MQSSNFVPEWRQPVWLATLAAASVAASLGLACAVPLGAFAALGALTLERRSAVTMIILVVVANQIIGFTILLYPRDGATFAWGPVFLLAGVSATLAAFSIKERCVSLGPALSVIVTFLAAFITYETVFFAVSLASHSEMDAYSAPIVARIFEVNLAVFVGLMVMERIAVALGLLKSQQRLGETVV